MNKIVVTFLAVLSLCSTSAAQQQPEKIVPDIAYIPKTPPRVTLEAYKLQYRADEDLILNITLENTDTKPIFFYVNEIVAFYKFEVIDSAGNKIPLRPLYRSFKGGEPWGLLAGQKRKGHVYLNRLFDLGMRGKYTVNILNISQFKSIPVTVKPFTFEIVSPPTLGGWD